MRPKATLLTVAALAAAALLVWQLAARRGSVPERAESPRTAAGPAEPAAPAAPERPAPGADGEPAAPGKPAAGWTADPNEGIRIRVLAESRPLPDAHVYVMADDVQHLPVKEEGGSWFAGATGDLTVGAAHARHGPARKKVRAEKDKVTDVTIELPPGGTLDVLVVADSGEAPVAGASVYVLRAGGKDLDGGNSGLEDIFGGSGPKDADMAILGTLDLTDLMSVGGAPAVAIPKLSTGADGRVRVEGLPKGTVDLVVSHGDFIPTRLKGKRVGTEAVARLSAGGSLTVLAPWVDGRAAEGYLCGAVRPGLMISMPVGSAKVDAEGKAFFPHLPPGPLRILVAKASHPIALMSLAMGGAAVETTTVEKGCGEGEETVEEERPIVQLAAGNVRIVSGEHATLDLREAKGARIEGVFVAGDKAREGAVVLLRSGDQQVAVHMTDDEGKFAFEGVMPGRYAVTAAGGAGGIARADCEVKEGDRVVTVRLEFPVGAIGGRLLGADGKPSKGRVLVAPREGTGGQASNLVELMEQLAGFAEADEEGRFRVQGIAAGEYRVLGAVGRRLDAANVTVREGEEVQVELCVDDARVRRLRVGLRGPDGAVEGSVHVLGPDGGAAETLALAHDEEIVEPASAAAHEFFLSPGRYRLVATAPGLAPVLGEAVDIAGDREVTLRLGPGVRVELQLVGPDGPLANRELDVRNEHGIRLGGHSPLEMLLGAQRLRTDGGGLLTLDEVPPGRYAVLVDGTEKGRFDVGASPVTRRIRVE